MRTIGSKVAPHFPPASGPSGVAPAPGSGSTENLDPGIWKLRGPPFGRTLRSSSPAATGRFLRVALPRARSSAAGSLQQFAKFLPGGGSYFLGIPKSQVSRPKWSSMTWMRTGGTPGFSTGRSTTMWRSWSSCLDQPTGNLGPGSSHVQPTPRVSGIKL